MEWLEFEEKTDLTNLINQSLEYSVENKKVKNSSGNIIGALYKKSEFTRDFLKGEMGLSVEDYWINTKQPDDCFVNFKDKTIYIIEKKFQSTTGTADEKPAACEFLLYLYEKIAKPIGYRVRLAYVFNDFFKQEKYKTMLDYMLTKDVIYWFNTINLNWLDL